MIVFRTVRSDKIHAVGYDHVNELSIGTVLNVLKSDPRQWRSDLDDARTLPGLRHIEIWLEHLPSRRRVHELRSMLSDIDVTVHGPFVDLNLSTSWGELGDLTLSRAQRALEIADLLGAAVFTIHAGKYPVYEDHAEALGRFADRFDRLARDANSTVAVENVKAKASGVSREVVATSEDMTSLTEILPEVQFTVDVAHALQNGDSPVAMIEELAGRLPAVHVHDVSAGNRSHNALGDGLLDLEAVARAILRSRPRFVTLETLGSLDTRRSWRRLHECIGRIAVSPLL